VNLVEAEAEEEMLLMAFLEEEESKSDKWYLDSGCSNHMCGNKELFSCLNENYKDTVKLGNGMFITVMGKGNVRFYAKDNTVQTISSIFYIPELKSNLISMGQLQEKGYTIIITAGCCKIHHPEKGVIAKARMTSNRMFPLYMQDQIQTCFSTKMHDSTWLWHFRYGHLNFDGLKALQEKNMVTGLPKITCPTELCEECVVGKQPRDSFPKGKAWRAEQTLHLVHSNICGPINPTSNGNKRYFISFINDCSRKTWVYFLQDKSEAFTVFKKFKAHSEKECGNPIKILRTDRGGEFTSHEFANFCEMHGIQRQLTAAYSPQQNGVAERRNRTIMNMVRSMLLKGKMPKSFWPEAVKWSVHILNRCPTFAVKNITPTEAWCGSKPMVDHFRIFGCIAYAHVPDAKRTKLDDKAVKCVFLGVSEESKAYKLYNPITRNIVISRDVQFDEENTWDWKKTDANLFQDSNLYEDASYGTEEGFIGDRRIESHIQPPECEIHTEEQLQVPIPHEGTIVPHGEGTSNIPQRQRTAPAWMNDYVNGNEFSDEDTFAQFALFAGSDPIKFEDAVKEDKWRRAMDTEIHAINKNNTWELVDLPRGQKTIGVKWVYKTKLNENGEIDKHKARLVVKGYKQQHGIDYDEVFAPVVRHDTIRLVISLAAQHTWPIFQMDVKSAFLNGDLEEQVYVDQPSGYVKQGYEEQVYKLNKALYGLKQAPRAWYSRIDAFFTKAGFRKCPHEHTLFVKTAGGGKFLFVCLYVDNLIYTGNDGILLQEFKDSMKAEFEMTDLGMMRYFLGIEVMQSTTGIFITQKKYAKEILERFHYQNCNPVKNPIEPGLKLHKDLDGQRIDSTYYKQMVGSLMYLTATRPDVMCAVSLLSRYMESPTSLHSQAAKRVFRYLQGTIDFGIHYKKGEASRLIGYADSNYAGDLDDRRSTSGSVFMMNSGAVSWSSRKQQVVTLSTTEAEFIAAATSACQAIWLRRILDDLHFQQHDPTIIHCDSSSAIKLSKNPVLHGRSKHIDVRYHFLRDLSNEGTIELVYCRSEDQIADIMTKALKLDAFEKLRNLLGMCSFQVLEQGN
jgi:hypothetical protein